MGRTPVVLLVDDDAGDALVARECFRQLPYPVDLRHVECGECCMAYLRREESYADVPTPDLILLDINMPRMDGKQVMRELAADERLRQLPVVALTTSSLPQDVADMYRLGCNSYIQKSPDLERFQKIIRTLCDYWFGTVCLPPAGSAQARPAA